MAIEAKVPIVPVSIIGADHALLDNGRWLLRPTFVKVIFHDPIETAHLEVTDAAALKEQVFEIIYETLTGEKPSLKANSEQ
jgi:1-acyl-sn-glycerol-3-phosphate acyltransferase